MKKWYFAILAACLAALLTAGCSCSNSDNLFDSLTFGTALEKTPTIEADLTPTPTDAATPAPVTEKRIGFITDAYTHEGVNYIKIDYVIFLTGDEAIQKAVEEGNAEKDENGEWYVPNDYYISNDNAKLRTFPLADNCVIKIIDFSGPGGSMTLIIKTFAELYALSDLLITAFCHG